MTSPPDGPDQPSHGHEYPPLEKAPPPPAAYAPVDYPGDAGQPPPGSPGQFGYPAPGYYQGPDYSTGGYPPPDYATGGYPPPPPFPGASPQGYAGGYPYAQNPYGYDPNGYGSAPPAGTNGKAIASLVTSLVGLLCCVFPGVVGIILGVMAMRETKRTGQEGHGMALAGVIIGGITVAFGLLGLVALIVGGVLDGTSTYSSY